MKGRTASALVALAMLPALPSAAGQAEALAGRWQLNEKESENARTKYVIVEAGQTPEPARDDRRPGGARPQGRPDPRSAPGRPGAAEPELVRIIQGEVPPAFADFLDPPRTLAIGIDGDGVVVEAGPGEPLRLPGDGRPTERGGVTRRARWEGSILVVEAETSSGGRLLTRYNPLPNERRLEVYARLADREGHAVTLRRVYDAEPQS